MSTSDRPSREVAHRVFAAEYNDATYTYRESDEERAPNYLVTPSGARVNRVFIVGVLTEVEPVGDDVLRARVVDPTGAFVVYAGQYQPDALAFFEDATPPMYVAVTGKANTFQPEDSDRIFTSVRPESVTEVDADTRDRWVLDTAERTLDRIAVCGAALDREERGPDLEAVLRESGVPPSLSAGIPHAIAEYGTTPTYLANLQTLATDTIRLVAGDLETIEPPDLEPDASGDATLDPGSLPDQPALVDDASTPDETVPEESDRTVEETTPEPGSVGETVGSDAGAGTPAEAEPAGEPGETVEREAGSGGTGGGADEPPEPEADSTQDDEFYELDDDERAAVEEEYDVEFSSGDDIPDAGEADIDTPETDADTPTESAADTTATDSGDDSSDTDLEDAVIEQMQTMADGGGVDRSALIDAVTTEHDVEPEAVEDAIQDALMSGRCYESGDDKLTPI